jgi:uncharacterized membrane protein YgdD (TMEM256/DUF423 family)
VDRLFVAIGSLAALLGVAAGAFGAHGLKSRLTTEMLAVFETGVRYQLVHALALLVAAWVCSRWPGHAASTAGFLFLIGIVVFSGSLYLLALTGVRSFGAVTPFGGIAFLAGWACLAWAAWRANRG